MSDLNSSICDKPRIILHNPDGTIIHCIKEEYTNSKESNPQQNIDKDIEIDDINISDDDLRHIIDISTETDYPFLIKQIISLFKNYINVFIIIKACEVFLSFYLLSELYFLKDASIGKINTLFRCGYDKGKSILITTLAVLIVFMGISAVIQLVMIKIKNLKLIKVSAYFTLVAAVIDIPMTYFHLGYLFLFSLDILLYSLNKFIINLIASVLIIPVQTGYYNRNDNYNTI